ncbi:30S ribosomal protein S4 [Planctomycetota bacterium]|nr:30S ribosomal protein S4 [Planctomycetota bacterium]
MARYTGPRLRIIRRLGTELPGLTTKTMTRRPYAPGMHGQGKRISKTSEYGVRLKEKQKLRFHYGLSERGLRMIFDRAQRMPGDTGRNMLVLLESRLDSLVWRAGLTRTIPAARQLIGHGHVNLNGHRAKSPGQRLGAGDTFQVRERARNREDLRVTVNAPLLDRPSNLKGDLDNLSFTLENVPGNEQVPFPVDIQKVIEYFAQ